MCWASRSLSRSLPEVDCRCLQASGQASCWRLEVPRPFGVGSCARRRWLSQLHVARSTGGRPCSSDDPALAARHRTSDTSWRAEDASSELRPELERASRTLRTDVLSRPGASHRPCTNLLPRAVGIWLTRAFSGRGGGLCVAPGLIESAASLGHLVRRRDGTFDPGPDS